MWTKEFDSMGIKDQAIGFGAAHGLHVCPAVGKKAPLGWAQVERHGSMDWGGATGYAVFPHIGIDVDPGAGGKAPEGMPPTLTVRTGKNEGRHYYFSIPREWVGRMKSRAGKLPGHPGVDVRVNVGKDLKGYLIGPGSRHPTTGLVYRVDTAGLDRMVDAPGWMCKLLAPETEVKRDRALSRVAETYDPCVDGAGGRSKLFGFMCAMRRAGASSWTALAPHWSVYNARCDPPWSDSADDALQVQEAWENSAEAVSKEIVRPGIVVTEGHGETMLGKVCAVQNAIAAAGDEVEAPLFVSAEGKLVYVSGERVVDACVDVLRVKLGQVCRPIVIREDGPKEGAWPLTFLASVYRSHHTGSPIRRLDSVSKGPVLLPGGELVNEYRYLKDTYTYIVPDTALPKVEGTVSEHLAWIEDRLEFPWKEDIDRHMWLAMLFTLASRSLWTGKSPMWFASASEKGTGKDRSMELAGFWSGGESQSVGKGKREGEVEKKFGVAVNANPGARMIYFSNLVGSIGDEFFDQLATQSTYNNVYSVRLLGTAKDVYYSGFLGLNGNNVRLTGDIPRRVAVIHMKRTKCASKYAKYERSWSSLIQKQTCAEAYARVLAILAAFEAAGCPTPSHKLMDSFEVWDAYIGGLCEWLGRPVGAHIDREAVMIEDGMDDSESEEHAELVARLAAAGLSDEWTPCQALSKPQSPAMRDVLDWINESRKYPINNKELGKLLHAAKDRPLGGRMLELKKTKIGKVFRILSV
jgi:Bifunctional DNA primase/polymerase, N-terminal